VNPGTFLRRVASNALALSALYLAVGLVVELLRAHAPSAGALRVSYALDALPARVLDRLGLLLPIREAYTDGRLSESMVRLLFGATAVGFIFSLALLLAALTLAVRHWLTRRTGPADA
jgi:hypothetical protein